MIANMPLKGEVIRACKNLKFIDVAFTGVDHVDLEAAKEMGVKVSNASGYSTQAVAELALGMMLSLLRNMPQVDERCRAGKTKDGLVGSELKGKTVGIVGAGAIGQNTARLCKAFGCRVIAYNHRPKQVEEGLLEFVDLDTLTREADIISLNCPLNDSTRGMFGKERIARMKKNAILINVARGPVVDSQALADALNEGRASAARASTSSRSSRRWTPRIRCSTRPTPSSPRTWPSPRRSPWPCARRSCSTAWTSSWPATRSTSFFDRIPKKRPAWVSFFLRFS